MKEGKRGATRRYDKKTDRNNDKKSHDNKSHDGKRANDRNLAEAKDKEKDK